MDSLRYVRPEPVYNTADTAVSKASLLLSETLTEFRNGEQKQSSDNIINSIERATELVLWQIDKLNEMHKKVLDDITKAECQVSTDLNRMHQISSRFINPADTRAGQLKDQLTVLNEKRNRAEMDYFDRRCKCLDKLVALVGKHKLMKT